MDVLARLGASAIGTTAASVKPLIAPLFLPATQPIGNGAATAVPNEAGSTPDAPDRQHSRVVPEPVFDQPRLMRAAEPVPRTSGDDLRRREPPHSPGPAGVRAQAALDRSSISIGPAPREAAPSQLVDTGSRRAAAATREGTASALAASGLPPRNRVEPVPSRDAATAPRDSYATETLVAPAPPDKTAAIFDRLHSLRESAPAPASARRGVVRVTIGRIEVRSAPVATPEPAVDAVRPPAPVHAPPPRLTLEQYLSRSRGER